MSNCSFYEIPGANLRSAVLHHPPTLASLSRTSPDLVSLSPCQHLEESFEMKIWRNLDFISIETHRHKCHQSQRSLCEGVLLNFFCLFVGHVMFSHDPHQFCEDGVWSGRLECFESNTISEWVSDQGRPRAARAAKNKNPFSVFLGPQIMKKKCDHCLTIIYIHFENNRNCFWSPKNKKSDLYGNMPYKRTVCKPRLDKDNCMCVADKGWYMYVCVCLLLWEMNTVAW